MHEAAVEMKVGIAAWRGKVPWSSSTHGLKTRITRGQEYRTFGRNLLRAGGGVGWKGCRVGGGSAAVTHAATSTATSGATAAAGATATGAVAIGHRGAPLVVLGALLVVQHSSGLLFRLLDGVLKV